jgi:hypothetical protein
MRRHPWLPPLLTTRPVLGPNGLVLLEHGLEALAPQPRQRAPASGRLRQRSAAGGPTASASGTLPRSEAEAGDRPLVSADE